MIMKWKVFYGDGSTVNGSFPVEAIPTQNVQIILIADDEYGRIMLHRYDYYGFDFDLERWFGFDLFGLWEYLTRPGLKKVLFGRTLPHEQWNPIYQAVKSDTDMPKKTGWTEREQTTEMMQGKK